MVANKFVAWQAKIRAPAAINKFQTNTSAACLELNHRTLYFTQQHLLDLSVWKLEFAMYLISTQFGLFMLFDYYKLQLC